MTHAITWLTDYTYETKVNFSPLPVLINFIAPLYGPCQALLPILRELSQDYKSKIEIMVIDVDRNRISSKRFNVRSIPAHVLLKNGEIVATQKNLATKAALIEFLHHI